MKYVISYVTPEMREQLDPDGVIAASFAKYRVPTQIFAPLPVNSKYSPEEWFSLYQKMLETINYRKTARPYVEYNSEMYSKYARQGGVLPLQELKDIVAKYYELADVKREIDPALYAARDYLIDRIRRRLRGRDINIENFCVKYYDTAAGVPTGAHKGDFYAETSLSGNWLHMKPTVPGYRCMRNKKRSIFGDAVTNVRAIERELTQCRIFLRTQFPEYFDAWMRPDLHLTGKLTEAVDTSKWFIETDYEGMDMHFSLQIVQELILPVYEAMLSDGAYMRFAASVEELFVQQVYWGDELWSGLHNLFSGVAITNDFETIYSIILFLAGTLKLHIRSAQVAAIGDDMSVAVKDKIAAQDYMDFVIDVSTKAGLTIARSKSGIYQSNTRFCRRVYYTGGVRDANQNYVGAYPSILVLNSIVQPERPTGHLGTELVADLQRCDNLYGSPEYQNFCHMFKKGFRFNWAFSSADISRLRVEWWERVYGERWDPRCSRTARLLMIDYAD